LLVLIAGFAAIATEALSQGPGSSPSVTSKVTPPVAEKESPRKSENVDSPKRTSATKESSSKDSSSKSFATSSQLPPTPSSPRKLFADPCMVTMIDDVKVQA